jgi:hypothetical protein
MPLIAIMGRRPTFQARTKAANASQWRGCGTTRARPKCASRLRAKASPAGPRA